MKRIFSLFAVLAVAAGLSYGQVALTSTTLSSAVNATQTSLTVASATGITGPSDVQEVVTILFIDKEAMVVRSVSGLTVQVRRNYTTAATAHASGSIVWVGPPNYFGAVDKVGPCTSTLELVLPVVNVTNGNLFRCTNSTWALDQKITNLYAPLGTNLDLNTQSDSKPVRINSRDYTQASGSSIGFQVKPNQTVANTDNVIGGEISPRIASGVAGKGITGLHVDAYLKGTAAGTISADVRGLELEMIADDGGTRTISGNVSAIRIRSAFSATTITGKFVPIRIEYPEAQTNSKTYDAAFEFTGKVPLVWSDDPTTELNLPGGTVKGYIKVLVNGAVRYIALYEIGNLAD